MWREFKADHNLAKEALYQGQLSSIPSGWKVHKLYLNSGIELCCSRGTSAKGICVSSKCSCVRVCACTISVSAVCDCNCMCVTPEPNESRYYTNKVLKVSMFSLVLKDSCWIQR